VPRKRRRLKKLIPLDDLKKVVADLIAVPKDSIPKPKGKPERRGQNRKKTSP
jgi:uncharacterized protein (DUF2384 family)